MVVQILGSFLSEVFHSDSIFFQSTFDSKNDGRRGRSSSRFCSTTNRRPTRAGQHLCVTRLTLDGTRRGGWLVRRHSPWSVPSRRKWLKSRSRISRKSARAINDRPTEDRPKIDLSQSELLQVIEYCARGEDLNVCGKQQTTGRSQSEGRFEGTQTRKTQKVFLNPL